MWQVAVCDKHDRITTDVPLGFTFENRAPRQLIGRSEDRSAYWIEIPFAMH